MRIVFLIIFNLLLSSCDLSQLNNPYSEADPNLSILYSSFSERPKRLDPATSYSTSENSFLAQIYEPPYQYSYLKRPYQLEPLSAKKLPVINYFNAQDVLLSGNFSANKIAYSEYIIEIKQGIKFQLHPAFIEANRHLSSDQIEKLTQLNDFTEQGTRELIAEDYVYQIKRLADPKVQSPIAEFMKEYIVGFGEFSQEVKDKKKIEIKSTPLSGVTVLSRYKYKIRIKGKYPQFKFWLAMNFFAPMPWEANEFYQQKGLGDKNISLNWYPIGTGPFFLEENNPNQRIVLTKNPNYHETFYPSEGEQVDKEKGLLKDAGRKLPFIDKVIYILEKETIPYWSKFLQGFYDASGISSDSFDQAVQFSASGNAQLTETMQDQGIRLQTSISTSIFYMGFNMLDPVIGGDSEHARKLRLAISIALDYEEYISIFMNGRGIPAQGVLPPEIFGNLEKKEGMNQYVYNWKNNNYQRKSIEKAEQLMTEAGYKSGVDPKTGEALVLYFDTTSVGAGARAMMNWYRKQFEKIGIKLVIRPTDYNRFQDKIRDGSGQIFTWGWNADYPDPENFFFLLYGPNGKVKFKGENAVNYQNSKFDQLFEQMRSMDDTEQRSQIIQQMQEIIRHDVPWVFGYHPKRFALYHQWFENIKPSFMAHKELKYLRIDATSREQKREQWNQAVFWPLIAALVLFILVLIPAINAFKKRSRKTVQ
ncbi:MAG: ABC transporter substrate-binding protein [Methylococcales bacterium]|nr:ABC transporter substrate-binding protein [Methylococcales bacterium]